MPQLDKVTFLSQFFWLCFFYLGFYYLILKFYLPKISRILALRRKKMGFSQEGMISLQQENQTVQENYETLLSKVLHSTKSVFNNFFSHRTNWLNNNSATINKTQFNQVNTSFISSLGDSTLSQNILFYYASKNLPENLTFKKLLENLRAMKSPSNAATSTTKKIVETEKQTKVNKK